METFLNLLSPLGVTEGPLYKFLHLKNEHSQNEDCEGSENNPDNFQEIKNRSGQLLTEVKFPPVEELTELENEDEDVDIESILKLCNFYESNCDNLKARSLFFDVRVVKFISQEDIKEEEEIDLDTTRVRVGTNLESSNLITEIVEDPSKGSNFFAKNIASML